MPTPSAPGFDPRLIRAYRRLLRAYPPGPRRDELLDTLILCAPPGRRRPTVAEVVNLVGFGGRARLGRPTSRGVVVLAVLVALAGGFLGAGAANRVGWHAVRPLPAGAEAAGIRETVFPGLHVWGGGDAARVVDQADGEGIEYGYAVSWVKHTPATRDVGAYTAAVRARLEAAGWTVTGVDPPLDETDMVGANPADRAEGFTATRGALGLRFADYYWAGRPVYDGDGNATYYLWQEPPAWLAAVTGLGFLPGAVLAWLLTGWASRRLEPHPWTTTPAVAGAGLGVLCVVPVTALTLMSGGPADETAAPSWQGLAFALTTPAKLSGILAAFLVLFAALQRPPRPLRPWVLRAATWTKVPRPIVILAVVTATSLVAGLGAYGRIGGRDACTPRVPAGIVDLPTARMSYQARVFISPQATDDQRNLAQAAIGRGFGGGLTFAGGPRSPGFLAPYCRHGSVDAGVAQALPRYWTVDLASPGLFGGLAAEMVAMPGVVAVQHVPGRA